jgi:tripartite ATP-independent transporter DctP family solute receptor
LAWVKIKLLRKTMTDPTLSRRALMGAAAAALVSASPMSLAAKSTLLRVSTPAVADDWHAKMWTVLKEQLDKQAAGQFEVQINLNGSLFKQGAEAVALARGNLELASISAFDIAKVVPAFSLFTAGYMLRDPAHLMSVLAGPIGAELYKEVSAKMDITVLSPLYLGTRELNLRQKREVKTPADLKGLKLRMPSTKEWLFLGNALGATATPLAFGEVYLGLKTGTIDAQDNPLPTTKSAKFYEVTQQITLTHHLVDSLFIVVANKLWNSLDAAQQQQLKSAAQAAAVYNNTQRIADEKNLLAFFESQGLRVTAPDVAPFRAAVQAAYAGSDMAKPVSYTHLRAHETN